MNITTEKIVTRSRRSGKGIDNGSWAGDNFAGKDGLSGTGVGINREIMRYPAIVIGEVNGYLGSGFYRDRTLVEGDILGC